jgi:hypothetical protein
VAGRHGLGRRLRVADGRMEKIENAKLENTVTLHDVLETKGVNV